MKILTKEEEQEHYNATLKGGLGGGVLGVLAGTAGVYLASARYPAFRSLTLPFRTFLIVSTSTFGAIVSADSYSRKFEANRDGARNYTDESLTLQQQLDAQKSTTERATTWARDNKYSIVFGSWVLSMGTALGLVGRNPYLSTQQKLVQARVYAQGLTIAVVIASLALEAKEMNQGQGRWQTVKVLDPDDPTHQHLIEKRVHQERYSGEDQWMDMVAAEEERIKERESAVKSQEAKDKKKGKTVHHKDPEHGDVQKSNVRAP